MPNWVHNKLSIEGDSVLLAECLSMIYKPGTKEIDFGILVPDNDDSSINWYYDNWGTKWNPEKGETRILLKGDSEHRVKFLTANGVPKPWLSRLINKFPQLKFNLWYVNLGEFYGYLKYKKGETKRGCFDPEINEENDWEGNDHYIYFIDKYFGY